MSKSIVLVAPVAALESRIAWRSEPAPLSPVFNTLNVDSSVRSSIHSRRGTIAAALDRVTVAPQATAERNGLTLGGFHGGEHASWWLVKTFRIQERES